MNTSDVSSTEMPGGKKRKRSSNPVSQKRLKKRKWQSGVGHEKVAEMLRFVRDYKASVTIKDSRFSSIDDPRGRVTLPVKFCL